MALFIRHKRPGPIKPTANPYSSRFQSWRQSLGITFFVLLLLGCFVRFYTPLYEKVKLCLFEGVAIVQGLLIQPVKETQAMLDQTNSYSELKEDYIVLQKENEQLNERIQNLNTLYHENQELRKSLQVPERIEHAKLTARIFSSPYDGLHHFFLIQAGEKDGLQKDLAVISSEGVVGRLEKVGNHVSRVLLLNDSNSRIPVKTKVSNQAAILAGDGSFFPSLVYVVDAKKVQKGEQVITSGLGGIFPPGLPVGLVEETSSGKITVRPFAPFQTLEWVHVLKPVSENYVEEVRSELEGE